MQNQSGVELVGDDLGRGRNKWSCTVLIESKDGSGNKYLYGIPYNERKVLKFDINSQTTIFIGQDFGISQSKFVGGTIGHDGCIYACPRKFNKILKVDPSNDSTTLIGGSDLIGASGGKYSGIVCAPNGFLYLTPKNASHILKVDPTSGSTTPVGDNLTSGKNKWIGNGIVAGDKIYFLPDFANKVLRLDLSNNNEATLLFGHENIFIDGSRKWLGGAVGNDGSIYCLPHNANNVLKIDTTKNTTVLVGKKLLDNQDRGKYGGCVMDTSGKLFCVPFNSNHIIRFNPDSKEINFMGSSLSKAGSWKWMSTVLTSDGCMYSMPWNAHQIIKIDLSQLPAIPLTFAYDGATGGVNDSANASAGADRLGYKTYAKGLCNVVRQIEKSESSLCVGISAPWGTGKSFIWNIIVEEIKRQDIQYKNLKTEREQLVCCCQGTSMMERLYESEDIYASYFATFKFIMLGLVDRLSNFVCNIVSSTFECFAFPLCCPRLQEDNDEDHPPKHIFVEFNAWTYSGTDLLWAAIIEQMWTTVENEFGSLRVRMHRASISLSTESDEDNVQVKRNKRRGAILLLRTKAVIFFVSFTVAGILFKFSVLNRWNLIVEGMIAFVGSIPFLASFIQILPILTSSQGKKFLREVKSFEKHERESFIAETGFMGRVETEIRYLYDFLKLEHMDDFETGYSRKVRLTLFIDDLDRCPKKTIMSVLEAVVLLLSDSPVTCYLAIDTRMVVSSIEDHFGENFKRAGLDGFEFLEKIIQVPFCIPTLDNGCKFNFVKKTLGSSEFNPVKVYKRAAFLKREKVPFFESLKCLNVKDIDKAKEKEVLTELVQLFARMMQEDDFFDDITANTTMLLKPGAVLRPIWNSVITKNETPEKDHIFEEFLYFISEGIEKKIEEHRNHLIKNATQEVFLNSTSIIKGNTSTRGEVFTTTSGLDDDKIRSRSTRQDTNAENSTVVKDEETGDIHYKGILKENDLSGYRELYHPMVDRQEMECFRYYCEHFIGKPRKIKRIINSYMLSREIATLNDRQSQSFRMKLLKLLVLTAQWPYRMTWLLLIAENYQQENQIYKKFTREEQYLPCNSQIISVKDELFKDWEGKNFLDIPLVYIYQKLVYVLMHSPADANIQVQRDGDPQDFVQLLSSDEEESRLLLKDIALLVDADDSTKSTLRPYIFNLPQHMQEKLSVHLENCVLMMGEGENDILKVQYKTKRSLFDQSSSRVHYHMATEQDSILWRSTFTPNSSKSMEREKLFTSPSQRRLDSGTWDSKTWNSGTWSNGDS